MENMVQAITDLMAQSDVPVFGLGPAAPLEAAPPGQRPSDSMPNAQSILCLGLPVPRGVFRSGDRANENYWRAACIYYRQIDIALLAAARLIEEHGQIALPVFG